ncbi:Zn(II)2Cys6 transcription factor [Aspergillus vadensis CBS 113365]|uniref:C6 transcription factor n=1 Tax=Aspergillus vadensis (strain CBS 113365 / IMI 142717 / IBT 24658) TaxID=1448311 RepID=A0A319D2K4_ASPVC|nr:C6 transcription factor [Aspergillus vadensis CBS 113365]PYH74342.1 C6 transcription factor [Aspergillus vadensis CBS 113365]
MSSRASITKKACDGCKIRKIRCGGGQPCRSCFNARIKCTYIRVQQPRGPQKLRATTKYLIDQAQRGIEVHDALPSIPQSGEILETDHASTPAQRECGAKSERSRIPTNVLASPLYIYHVRMYPVWPIVDVENVMSSLQQDVEENDHETYALATAVAAATIAQLRLGQNSLPDKSVTAETFAAECMKARRSCDYRSRLNLNNVRTAFFLHVYFENHQSGASESLLYLREAITLAQMMCLHREVSYAGLPSEEQQMRRRVLWLLFVTERGVCILHKLPVVLRTDISTPELDANDEPQVLPAFLKLLNLFRLFEQSKMFDIIEDDQGGFEPLSSEVPNLDSRFLRLLQDNLQDGSALLDHISDVQKADLCVTRHWMRMILWKFSSKKSAHGSSTYWPTSPSFPILVAKELLNIVSQLPRAAIEAHGLGMELKLYEIASSLADAVIDLAMLPRAPSWDNESRPSSILARLHSILSTFRGGGNKELAELLYRKMADAQARSGPALSPPIREPQPPVKSKMLPAATTTSASGGEDLTHKRATTAMEAAGPIADDISPLNNWSTATEAQLPTMQSVGQGHIQDSLSLVHHAQSGYSGLQPLEDMLFPEFAESTFPTQLESSESVYDPSFGNLLPYSLPLEGARSTPMNFASLSPALPSGSVEMLINDFISQIPEGQFTPEPNFSSNDFPDAVLSGEGFLLS